MLSFCYTFLTLIRDNFLISRPLFLFFLSLMIIFFYFPVLYSGFIKFLTIFILFFCFSFSSFFTFLPLILDTYLSLLFLILYCFVTYCTTPFSLREILITADSMGMLEQGGIFIISITIGVNNSHSLLTRWRGDDITCPADGLHTINTACERIADCRAHYEILLHSS